jgi:DNA mismatch repair ATPase MutS
MTIFNDMRTCLNPKENMKNRMSTFMAASAAMEALRYFVRDHDGNKKYIILIDEPYRGTVNDETAVRTGQFLREIADKDYLAAVVATHIMPELTEQERTKFGYQHVEIQEQKEGDFKRTFTLQPGLCDWWFKDKAKRSRYVDWIKTQCELPGCLPQIVAPTA